MRSDKKIAAALISVYHKEGLDDVVRELVRLSIPVYSTGGTADYLRGLGATVHEVADLTQYPSILGGRVKTLHPKVFGGILGRRDLAEDQAEMQQYEIPPLDLVIVDLYPFEATVASGASDQAIIEKIDIGGISLIRAGAKNHKDVLIVPSQAYYAECARLLREQDGSTTLEQRRSFAAAAFNVSSHYDTHIFRYISGYSEESLKISQPAGMELRYGENPHQKARFFGDLGERLEQIHGKALSYNNLLDIDAALNLMEDFRTGMPCFAIFKHTNPCGVALAATLEQAWTRALECDPLSAFGGILIGNGTVTAPMAEAMRELFFEVLIAPAYTEEALVILREKKNRILLIQKPGELPAQSVRSAVNGYLVQDRDTAVLDGSVYQYKSSRQASAAEMQDVIFGEKIVKHLKSNAIAIVRNGQLIGSGMGQTSRVDALKQAIAKARERGFDPKGAVLTSDAFFPFADCAEIALQNGIEILAEPGGSIRDEDTINFCESHQMCLIFTAIRHFKH